MFSIAADYLIVFRPIERQTYSQSVSHRLGRLYIKLDASLAPVVPIYLIARLFPNAFYCKTAKTTVTSYRLLLWWLWQLDYLNLL